MDRAPALVLRPTKSWPVFLFPVSPTLRQTEHTYFITSLRFLFLAKFTAAWTSLTLVALTTYTGNPPCVQVNVEFQFPVVFRFRAGKQVFPVVHCCAGLTGSSR